MKMTIQTTEDFVQLAIPIAASSQMQTICNLLSFFHYEIAVIATARYRIAVPAAFLVLHVIPLWLLFSRSENNKYNSFDMRDIFSSTNSLVTQKSRTYFYMYEQQKIKEESCELEDKKFML